MEAGEEEPGRDRAAPRRGQPDPAHPALRHPAQDGADAQPLRAAQPDPRARSPLHRPPRTSSAGSSARRGSSSAAPSSRGCAPLPFFLEALVGVFNGDNEDAFGRGKLNEPLVTGRLRTFFELTDAGAIQLGASVASGETPERLRNTLVGFDAKYKFTPGGLAASPAHRARRGDLPDPPRQRARGGHRRRRVPDTPDQTARPQPLGLVRGRRGAAVRPAGERFGAGFRYDWTQYPVMRGREWAVEPFVTFMPVGVPALPPGLQAHRARQARRLHRQRRQRPDGGRDPLPGHLHPGRPPGASLLRRPATMRCRIRAAAIATRRARPRGARPRGPRLVRRTPPRPTSSASSRPSTDLKALTEAVGGDLVEVDSLARGTRTRTISRCARA